MLIPSIDLQGGKVVQLIQGQKLALDNLNLEEWMARFRGSPVIQLIDLDAAMGTGSNDGLVRDIVGRRTCRVGGGVRSIDRAKMLIDAGAEAVIVSSAYFDERALSVGSGDAVPKGSAEALINFEFAQALVDAIGAPRIIAAVDSRSGKVVIHGWKTMLDISTVEAVRALEPYCGGFLYTHVDKEGMMQGTDMNAIRAVVKATSRKVTAAGGITTREDIQLLDAMGVDAVVGMAMYTGALQPD